MEFRIFDPAAAGDTIAIRTRHQPVECLIDQAQPHLELQGVNRSVRFHVSQSVGHRCQAEKRLADPFAFRSELIPDTAVAGSRFKPLVG